MEAQVTLSFASSTPLNPLINHLSNHIAEKATYHHTPHHHPIIISFGSPRPIFFFFPFLLRDLLIMPIHKYPLTLDPIQERGTPNEPIYPQHFYSHNCTHN